MRPRRFVAPPHYERVFFHCISRVVDRSFRFGPDEKDAFVELMRRCEDFHGVRILTYVVMSNHFHLLVEVPRRPEEPLSDAEIWRRAEVLNGPKAIATMRQRWDQFVAVNDVAGLQWIREYYTRRMWNISDFMKELKQRFTRWFNKARNRKGTLWEERFKSVMVEGADVPLTTMAAYIDLNPVRANLVTDPAAYRWCGYAEAMAGGSLALHGLRVVSQAFCLSARRVLSLLESLERYRTHLHVAGVERLATVNGQVTHKRLGFSREQVQSIIADRGKLSADEALRCRVRYFQDAVALGSRDFVNAVFESNRGYFGPRRTSGARKLQFVDLPGLFSLRDLQVNVVQSAHA